MALPEAGCNRSVRIHLDRAARASRRGACVDTRRTRRACSRFPPPVAGGARGPRSRSRTASAHLRSPFALAPAARREFIHRRSVEVSHTPSAFKDPPPPDLCQESGGAELHHGVQSEACAPDAER